MENIVKNLIEYRDKSGCKDKDILIMLSLLNLLSTIEVLKERNKKEGGSAGANNMPFDITKLMGLLGGQGQGSGLDISNLAGMLGNLMGGSPGGQQAPSAPKKDDSGFKVEKNAYKPEGKKNNTAPKDAGKSKKEGEVLRWNFEEKKKC